jgi:hypothetical protein
MSFLTAQRIRAGAGQPSAIMGFAAYPQNDPQIVPAEAMKFARISH